MPQRRIQGLRAAGRRLLTALSVTTLLPLLATPVAAAAQDLPTLVGPIPVTAASHPYLGAAVIMTAAGYVEEEYFLKGRARTYEWVGASRQVQVVAGPSNYVTRILVRRPRDPAKFSGKVEVNVLNASLGVDQGGPTDFRAMVDQGDAWVGITSKALTANALRRFDPVRYASLDWSNPAPAERRCAQPTIIPVYTIGGPQTLELMTRMGMQGSSAQTEDGLVWDMLAQLARVLKSDAGKAVLPGSAEPKLYLTGVSQSSLLIRTWVTAFHDRERMADGKPLYDGYLAVVGPAMLRLNQCSVDVLAQDPRQKLATLDVPFVSLSSEGEMWLSRHTRQPDAIARRSGIVTYEVAGASHPRLETSGLAPDTLRLGPPADQAKAGFAASDGVALARMTPAGYRPNTFAWAPVVRGAYRNLRLWAEQGQAPPTSPLIALDENLQIRRDANGNALGGLRLPYIDAATATHHGAVSDGGPGAIFGVEKPFSPETLKALYPDHAAYVAKFSASADRLAAGRWVSVEDAAAMKAAARSAPIP